MHICCIYTRVYPVVVAGNTIELNDSVSYSCPMGIAYISSSLKQAGHETEILFYNVQQEEIYKRVKPTDKLVLFSIISEGDYEIEKKLIREIKGRYPKIKVGVGGAYPTLVPETIMSNKDIDMVCIGEGEIANVEYARQVEEGKYRKTDNLWIKDNDGQIIKCDRSVVIEDIDSLPYPDRDGWNKVCDKNEKNKKQRVEYILLERGCNNRCVYCSNRALSKKQEGKYLRYRNLDKVIEEMEYICTHYPSVQSIRFNADNSLSAPDYFKELCQRLIKFNEQRQANKKEKLSFSLAFNITPYLATQVEKIIDLIKKANVVMVSLSLEAVSLEIRKKLIRPYYTNEQFLQFFKSFKKANIRCSVVILYIPYLYTKEIYKETINYLARLKMDILQICWLTAFKGTQLVDNKNIVPYEDARLIDKFKFHTLEYRVFFKAFGFKMFKYSSPVKNCLSFIYDKILCHFNNKTNSFYIRRSKKYFNSKEYQKAIKYFNKVKIDESNYWVYGDRAFAKMEVGDYKGAIEDFDKVLILEPKEIYKEKREECLKLLDRKYRIM